MLSKIPADQRFWYVGILFLWVNVGESEIVGVKIWLKT